MIADVVPRRSIAIARSSNRTIPASTAASRSANVSSTGFKDRRSRSSESTSPVAGTAAMSRVGSRPHRSDRNHDDATSARSSLAEPSSFPVAGTAGPPQLTEPLQDHRHALTAADAHGLQPELLVVALQPVDQRAR